MINPNWDRWVWASMTAFMDQQKGPFYLFIEGLTRVVDGKKAFIEFRMNGPNITEVSNNLFYLDVVINFCVQQSTDSYDAHAFMRAWGWAKSMIQPCIPIFKYGEELQDDQSQLGTMLLQCSSKVDFVKGLQLGQVDPVMKLMQGTIEGNYRMQIRGTNSVYPVTLPVIPVTGLDTLSFADMVAVDLIHNVNDTLSLSDFAVGNNNEIESTSNPLALIDSVNQNIVHSQSLSDIMSLADLASGSDTTHSASISDPMSLVDIVNENVVWNRSLSDVMSLADLASFSNQKLASASSAMSLTDTASQNIVHHPSISDPMSLVDSATFTGIIPRTGLQLWLEADLLNGTFTDGQTVTSWPDQSGNGRTATLASGTPIFKSNIQNGHGIVRFNGSSWFTTPSFQTFPSKRGTLVIVFNNTGSAAYELMGIDDGAGHFWAAYTSATPAATKPKWNDGTAYTVTNYDTTTFTLQEWLRTGDTTVQYYLGGTLTNTFTVQNIQQGAATAGVGIGTDPVNFNNNAFHGDICEIMMYDHDLSSSDRTTLENYLKAKWSV